MGGLLLDGLDLWLLDRKWAMLIHLTLVEPFLLSNRDCVVENLIVISFVLSIRHFDGAFLHWYIRMSIQQRWLSVICDRLIHVFAEILATKFLSASDNSDINCVQIALQIDQLIIDLVHNLAVKFILTWDTVYFRSVVLVLTAIYLTLALVTSDLGFLSLPQDRFDVVDTVFQFSRLVGLFVECATGESACLVLL